MAAERWFCNEEWNPTIEEQFFKNSVAPEIRLSTSRFRQMPL
jgi:hypothetical protein